MNRNLLAAGFLALFIITYTSGAKAGLVNVGSQYTFNGTNFIDNNSANVTLDQSTKTIDGGRLSISEDVLTTGPNSEWVEFNLSSTSGGPLAGNVNGGWRGEIDNISFNVPVALDAFFVYWDQNGQPFANIDPFFSNTTVTTNPMTGTGEVYLGLVSGDSLALTKSLFTDLQPYSQLSGVNIDPNAANSWHIAGHYSAPSVPEPSTLALLALGAPALVAGARRRRAVRSNP